MESVNGWIDEQLDKEAKYQTTNLIECWET